MSIFYSSRFTQRFPVSLLALEHLEQLSQHQPLPIAISQVLQECCGLASPTEADGIYFLERLQEPHTPEPSAKPQRPQTGKTLGTAYNKFLLKLPVDRLLLLICQGDYNKADYLYSSVDSTVAIKVIEDYLSLQQETNIYLYEAVLYGFGGSYKDDDSGAEEMDLSGASADEINALFR